MGLALSSSAEAEPGLPSAASLGPADGTEEQGQAVIPSNESLKIMVNKFPSTCHGDRIWQENQFVWYTLLFSLAHHLLRGQGELLPPVGLSWSQVSS